jgi:hypothetical protein
MKETLLLKPGEQVLIESKASKFNEDKAMNINGYLYLTTIKLVFVNGYGIIELYLPIDQIVGVCSTGGFFSKYLVIQYLFSPGHPTQIMFKLKDPQNWVKEIYGLVTSEKK